MRILVTLVGFLLVCRLADCSTLRALFLFQRHGDRKNVPEIRVLNQSTISKFSLFDDQSSTAGAPNEDKFPPNDPNRNPTYWPNGFNELTDRGRQRMVEVGLFLRERYAHFLTDDTSEISLLSSSAERCQKTGRSVVSGAYSAINHTDLLRSITVHIDKVGF